MYRDEIRRIMVAVNVIEGACAQLAKKIGMKENTLTLFYALEDGRAHTQKEICEAWLLPKTTLNTIVRECVEAGYIVLDSGKKEKEIRMTEKGREYAGEALGIVHELERKAMEQTLEKFPPEFARAMTLFANCFKEEACGFSKEERL